VPSNCVDNRSVTHDVAFPFKQSVALFRKDFATLRTRKTLTPSSSPRSEVQQVPMSSDVSETLKALKLSHCGVFCKHFFLTHLANCSHKLVGSQSNIPEQTLFHSVFTLATYLHIGFLS
jgi:hypothetical protein